MDNNWYYKGKVLNEDLVRGWFGFIYITTYLPTGQQYLGKKNLFFERNKPLGKKALLKLKEERKLLGMRGKTPTKAKVITESDWRDYYGSHELIKKEIKAKKFSNFYREIIQFALNKKHLTYLELKYQMIYGVIENDGWLNDNVLGKFYRADFSPENSQNPLEI